MQTSLSQQSGVVLMVSLVMLLLLSIIGVTGSQVTALEEKMAGNSLEQNIAFQAAEAALRAGELVIENHPPADKLDLTVPPGLVPPPYANALHLATEGLDYKADTSWVDAESVEFATTIPSVSAQPRYFIEYISDKPANPPTACSTPPTCISFFRVTARGTGRQSTTRVFLQSYYGRKF
jgi:type IV pilus assembly protein PilX